MPRKEYPYMPDKDRAGIRGIQDTAANNSDVFINERSEMFEKLAKSRAALRGVMKAFDRDKGTGKNDYKRGLAAQKHKADIDGCIEEMPLKIVGGTECK